MKSSQTTSFQSFRRKVEKIT